MDVSTYGKKHDSLGYQETSQMYSSLIIVRASGANLIFPKSGLFGPVRMVDEQECKLLTKI
jgi:hypothetical protein